MKSNLEHLKCPIFFPSGGGSASVRLCLKNTAQLSVLFICPRTEGFFHMGPLQMLCYRQGTKTKRTAAQAWLPPDPQSGSAQLSLKKKSACYVCVCVRGVPVTKIIC